MADEHTTKRKEGMREKIMRWGVIAIIALFVIEMFIVIMYPTHETQEQQQQEKAREFNGIGRANAKILSFTSDLYVVCNATSPDAARLMGEAINQSPAIAVSSLEEGQMYYLKLAAANQSNAQTIGVITQALASACSNEPVVLRQANVQFTEPLTIVNPDNTSETLTLSTYSLRDGAKAFVTDENAVEGQELSFTASASVLGTTVLQLIAQQSQAASTGSVEQKSGMAAVNVVRLEPKGMAVKQFAWELRNNVSVESIQANLSAFNATVDYRKSSLVEVAANESQLAALRNLSFVADVQQNGDSTLISVAENYSDKQTAMSEIARILNTSEDNVGFYTSNAVIDFYFNETSNFTQLIDEMKQALGNDVLVKRVGVVSPTNVTGASENLGFEVPQEFEALLAASTNASQTTIVFVNALVQDGKVVALTAEE